MPEWQPSIPGIDLSLAGDQRMKRALTATMAALDTAGALSATDAAEVQALIIMSEQVDRAAYASRATVAAVNERSGFMDKLIAFRESRAAETGPTEGWDAFLDELNRTEAAR